MTRGEIADDEAADVSRLVSTARIILPRPFRAGLAEIIVFEIRPHTGMRANALSSGNTASNTAPPTFSK